MQDYRDYLAEVLIPEGELKQRVRELGEEISRGLCRETTPGDLHPARWGDVPDRPDPCDPAACCD